MLERNEELEGNEEVEGRKYGRGYVGTRWIYMVAGGRTVAGGHERGGAGPKAVRRFGPMGTG